MHVKVQKNSEELQLDPGDPRRYNLRKGASPAKRLKTLSQNSEQEDLQYADFSTGGSYDQGTKTV